MLTLSKHTIRLTDISEEKKNLSDPKQELTTSKGSK